MILTPEEMREMKCQACGDSDPECKGYVLASRCHMGKGTETWYLKSTHQLVIRCHVCKKQVATINLERPS